MNSKVANAKVVYLNANLMHTDEKLVQKWYSVINNYRETLISVSLD